VLSGDPQAWTIASRRSSQKRLSGCRRGLRPKKPSRSSAPFSASSGFGIRDARPRAVVVRLAERHDHVEAVHRTALKDRDEPARARGGLAGQRVRAKNAGAKPRLTKAKAPFFRKTRRECMDLFPLEFRPANRERRVGCRCARGGRRSSFD
jgi:hypothetical protein